MVTFYASLSVITSNPAITVDSGIVETHISDHYLVFVVLNLRMPKPPAAYVVARRYKHYDPRSFFCDLHKIPWYGNMLSDDVNEKLLHFNQAFFRVLDNHAPIKKIKIKDQRCPFINEEIKEKMAKRDQAHKIGRETGALVDWQYYRDYRNDVKRVLREALLAQQIGMNSASQNNFLDDEHMFFDRPNHSLT